jgi:hypothetical protein
MTLAIILVIASALALLFIVGITVSRSLHLSSGASLASKIQPIDVAAFRNLIDPAEDDYLRRRLPSSEFRLVRRQRLLATAAYVRTARRNAAVLIRMGQAAEATADTNTSEAGRQLADNALRLHSNTTLAIVKIYVALAWPNSGLAATPVLHGYERLNGAAMLLGRLQNPAAPVRISASL